jgi:DNA-binding response OmpR family regulator
VAGVRERRRGSANVSASRSERWRALIVDDEASCRRLISASLYPQFETFEAASGEEALEVFDRVAPDVVLLDLTMPGLDGLEVARRLKRRTQRLVPIFLVTAADQPTTLAAGVGAGVDDFLAKPFDARLFLPRFEVFRRFGEQQQRMIRPTSRSRRRGSWRWRTKCSRGSAAGCRQTTHVCACTRRRSRNSTVTRCASPPRRRERAARWWSTSLAMV